MSPVGNQRKLKRDKSAELQRDSHGYSILEANAYFQGRQPTSNGEVDCVDVMREMHERFSVRAYYGWPGQRTGTCWLCGATCQVEAAHIVPRSDELCNIAMLGGRFSKCKCHSKSEKNWAMLPQLLAAKLEHDPLNTDFRRICELRGKTFAFDSLK